MLNMAIFTLFGNKWVRAMLVSGKNGRHFVKAKVCRVGNRTYRCVIIFYHSCRCCWIKEKHESVNVSNNLFCNSFFTLQNAINSSQVTSSIKLQIIKLMKTLNRSAHIKITNSWFIPQDVCVQFSVYVANSLQLHDQHTFNMHLSSASPRGVPFEFQYACLPPGRFFLAKTPVFGPTWLC